MKRKPIFISLACLSIVLIGALMFYKNNLPAEKIMLSADYPKYDSLENLVDRADTIIRGKIIDWSDSELNISQDIDSDDEYLNPGGEKDNSTIPYTVYTVEIEEIYKGNIKEKETIQVKQLGGTIGNVEYVLEDAARADFEKEKNYLFFLETYPDSPASLLNPLQSSYELDNNNTIIYKNKQKNQDQIYFNIEDLKAITNLNN